MNVGDRVKHKKYGYGTAKAVYQKNNAVRVEYDSGHVTTNAQSRVTVQTQTAGRAVETAPPSQPVKRRTVAGAGSVDYTLLERARQAVTAAHPEADHVVSRIYNGSAYCEVWKDNAAQIVQFEEAA